MESDDAGVFLEHVSWMSTQAWKCVPSAFLRAVAARVSASPSSSLVFAAGKQPLDKNITLLQSTASCLALTCLRPPTVILTSLCSLSWRQGKQWTLGFQTLCHRGIVSCREGTEPWFGKILTDS